MSETAGYSKRGLLDKLGLRAGARVLLINAPSNYFELLGELPPNLTITDQPDAPLDFIHLFTTSQSELQAKLPALKQALDYKGMLWLSWPKRSSKVPTDLSDNLVRGIGLACGLVDVKVSAIDQIWSGLKFVYRLKDRPT